MYTLPGGRPGDLAGRLDRAVRADPHSACRRDLGQLRPARLFIVAGDAYAEYAEAAVAWGRRLADVKAVSLAGVLGWPLQFAGHCATRPAR